MGAFAFFARFVGLRPFPTFCVSAGAFDQIIRLKPALFMIQIIRALY